jgi:hypothetical protein
VTTHVYMLRVNMETVARRKADMQLRSSAVSSEKRGKATVTLSTVDFTRSTVWKPSIACDVFHVAGRPVAGNSVDRNKGALDMSLFVSRMLWCCAYYFSAFPVLGALTEGFCRLLQSLQANTLELPRKLSRLPPTFKLCRKPEVMHLRASWHK